MQLDSPSAEKHKDTPISLGKTSSREAPPWAGGDRSPRRPASFCYSFCSMICLFEFIAEFDFLAVKESWEKAASSKYTPRLWIDHSQSNEQQEAGCTSLCSADTKKS